jgi:hypothetical protein
MKGYVHEFLHALVFRAFCGMAQTRMSFNIPQTTTLFDLASEGLTTQSKEPPNDLWSMISSTAEDSIIDELEPIIMDGLSK